MKKKSKGNRLFELLSFLILSLVVLFVSYNFIYPMKDGDSEVVEYLKREQGLSNIEIKNKEEISGKYISGEFYLFTYGVSGETLGKVSFTKLFSKRKVSEIHLDSGITDLNILKIEKKHYRLFSGNVKDYQKIELNDGISVKEFIPSKEYEIWKYEIEEKDLNLPLQIQTF